MLAVSSFNASCIEKFGNGGGNFRRLYAGFLEWAHALDPNLAPVAAAGLALESADAWTAASHFLYRVAEEGPVSELFDQAAKQMERVAAIERQLFESIAG